MIHDHDTSIFILPYWLDTANTTDKLVFRDLNWRGIQNFIIFQKYKIIRAECTWVLSSGLQ